MGSLYIHIPYCKQVCYYCDFHFRVAMKDKAVMLESIKKEIALRKDYLSQPEDEEGKIPIETLYFGGGTPSVLSISELTDLWRTIEIYYSLVPDAEITIEANPDDLTDGYLSELYMLGFNRLSIGIQSFFDDDLRWMNRRHNARETIQSVKSAQGHGFDNINADLIYGLPSMTLERWKNNLKQMLALDIPHVSAYHLTIEPKTVFGRQRMKGNSFSISEENSIRQFEVLLDIMTDAGYEQYEISNFAKPGFCSRHNSGYWQNKPYVGIGPSAHSYDGDSRQWNLCNNSQYIKTLHEKDGVWFDRELLSPAEKYNDYVLTSLRAIWGVNIGYIRDIFGESIQRAFSRQVHSYVQNGFVEQRGNIFVLTWKGKMIADRIASDLFLISGID